MAVYTEAIQKLYVAYFNRPADVEGLNFWEKVLAANNGDISLVSRAHAASPEYQNQVAGKSNYEIVNQIYNNLFNRDADVQGLQFWADRLAEKTFTVDQIVKVIADNASDTEAKDATTYKNKVAAATAFTAELNTVTEIIGYTGDAANAAAKQWLSTVSTTESLNAAVAPAALQATVVAVTNPPVPGQTFTLTAGADAIIGTSADDVINALSVNASGAATTTFSTFDKIDGGAGNDTLNIYTTSGTPGDATATPAVPAVPGNNSVFPTSATVTNVETINIYNAGTAAALADASQFVGATQIWQIGASAAAVTKLGTSTTAGFDGTTTNMSVSAAGESAAVALRNVVESATLTVNGGTAGGTLSSVTVSGTRVDGSDDNTSVSPLTLNMTAGKDVQSVTVNSAVSTVLSVAAASSSAPAKGVQSVDASASAGAIRFNAANATTGVVDANVNTGIRTLKTGTGNDNVSITTTTRVNDTATTTVDETISASVSTGAGNDTINVYTTGEGLTTVDAGAGNDTINVSANSQNVTVIAGAGDDVISFNRGVGAKDVVNGGEGTDYLDIKGTSLIAQDYEILRAVVSNVEGLSLADAAVGVDASKLTQFSEFTVNADGTSIVKVADAQSIVAYGDVTLTTTGYVGGNATTGAGATYAGTLNVYAEGGTAAAGNAAQNNVTVNAHANAIVLDVAAAAATSAVPGAASFVELTGDVKTATVNLTNSVNAATSATATADAVATFVLTTGSAASAAAGADAAGFNQNGALTSLILTGNGQANVTNTVGSKLASIDASGMTGVAAYDATAKVGGLKFVGLDTLAETVKLGGGKDIVTTSSTYNAMDTITGFTLVAGTTAGTVDHAKSDDLIVTGTNFAKTTVTGATLGLALTDAASKDGNSLVFTYGGDTYVFVDNANTAIDSSNTVGTFGADDIVIKLTGTVDLDLLALVLNGNGAI